MKDSVTTDRFANNIMDICYYGACAEDNGKIVTIGMRLSPSNEDHILYKTKNLDYACEFVFYLNSMRIDYYTTLTHSLPVIYRLCNTSQFVNYNLQHPTNNRFYNRIMLLFEGRKPEIAANWEQEGF